jgi:hypothetical protein
MGQGRALQARRCAAAKRSLSQPQTEATLAAKIFRARSAWEWVENSNL